MSLNAAAACLCVLLQHCRPRLQPISLSVTRRFKATSTWGCSAGPRTPGRQASRRQGLRDSLRYPYIAVGARLFVVFWPQGQFCPVPSSRQCKDDNIAFLLGSCLEPSSSVTSASLVTVATGLGRKVQERPLLPRPFHPRQPITSSKNAKTTNFRLVTSSWSHVAALAPIKPSDSTLPLGPLSLSLQSRRFRRPSLYPCNPVILKSRTTIACWLILFLAGLVPPENHLDFRAASEFVLPERNQGCIWSSRPVRSARSSWPR